jgi:CrcB protein
MAAYLWVAAGGAIGSVARYWLSGFVGQHWGERFPWGTIVVNIVGCFVIGLFATLTGPDGRWLVPQWFRQPFFILGICGGFTTFSSFSMQTLNLAQAGQWLWAGANVVISVFACLLATWGGLIVGSLFNTARSGAVP